MLKLLNIFMLTLRCEGLGAGWEIIMGVFGGLLENSCEMVRGWLGGGTD